MINEINAMNPTAAKYRLGNLIAAAAPFAAFTRGNHYFVDQEFGKDSYSGTDIKYAFKTVQKAVDKCSGESDDYIFLLPQDGVDYTADTVSTSLAEAYIYINKSNVHLIGINASHGQSVIINPGAAATAGIINLGSAADRCEIAGITFDTTTAANEGIATAGGCDGVWIHDCRFIAGGGTTDGGIIATNAATCGYWVIENCYFTDQNTAAITGCFNRGIIRNNMIARILATAEAAANGILILDNTTTADSDGVMIYSNILGCGISGGDPVVAGIVVPPATISAMVVNNYIGGSTDNLSITENTAGSHAINNFTYDQGQGNVAYATIDDKLPG